MRKTMFVGAVMASAMSGCGGMPEAEPIARDQADLKAIAVAYTRYQETFGKPPDTLADLIDHQTKTGGVGLPAGIGRMKLPWGAGFGSLYREGEAAGTVFAYGTALNGNVAVLMADGSVRTLTQAELDTAKKVTRLPKR